MRRNAVYSLLNLNIWNAQIKPLLLELLNDSYYEVRVAALRYLAHSSTPNDYSYYQQAVAKRLRTASIEEKVALIKLLAKIGNKEEIDLLKDSFLCSNSLIREELMQLFSTYYRRKLLTADEVKAYIDDVLITSNHLSPEFKLKSMVKKIYKEIE